MKNVSRPTEGDLLLDYALADDSWRAYDAELRHHARVVFGKAVRRRKLGHLALRTSAAFILLAAVVLTSRAPRSSPASQTLAAAGGQNPADHSAIHTITEAEMLAMFPAGSCAVAEINGEKQLVFFDDRIARAGVAVKVGVER
jgi:hypothetical protein